MEPGVGSRYLIYWFAWEPKVPNIWGAARSGLAFQYQGFRAIFDWLRNEHFRTKVDRVFSAAPDYQMPFCRFLVRSLSCNCKMATISRAHSGRTIGDPLLSPPATGRLVILATCAWLQYHRIRVYRHGEELSQSAQDPFRSSLPLRLEILQTWAFFQTPT